MKFPITIPDRVKETKLTEFERAGGNLISDNLDIAEGESKCLFYVKTFNDTIIDKRSNAPKELEGVLFYDNVANQMVQSFSRSISHACKSMELAQWQPLEIVCTGTADADNTVKLYEVYPLKVKN